jgi:gamma-glutamylcyclotransferase (GGCT)/AIG2-like uncharacterized protein YtfP
MPEAASHPTSSISEQRHVFVYGTLRRGDDNDITQLTPAPRLVGVGEIEGILYHLGAYPGVVLGPGGRVHGEVYAIESALERVLDEIEALYPQESDEYVKRLIPVVVGLQVLDCIVYEINPAYVAGKPVIASGDWVRDR